MENNKDKKITIKDLEKDLWNAADELRGNLSAEAYMHVVLGILALKFINDKYEKVYKMFIDQGLTDEDLDSSSFQGENAFMVTEQSKWENIMKMVGTQDIGYALDQAIVDLGKNNKSLEGVFLLYIIMQISIKLD